MSGADTDIHKSSTNSDQYVQEENTVGGKEKREDLTLCVEY